MNKRKNLIVVQTVLSLLFLILFVTNGFSVTKHIPTQPPVKQAPVPVPPPAPEVSIDDPLGRSTPQGAVVGFMRAMDHEDYERAVEYLDTKQSGKRAEQLAQDLQYVVNTRLSGNIAELSNNPEGNLKDGLRSDREKFGTIKIQSTIVDILLERVQRGDDPPVWLFSSYTLRRLPDIRDELKRSNLERRLPSFLVKNQILHVPLWHWFAFVILIPLFMLTAWIIVYALTPLIRPLVRRLLKNGAKQTVAQIKNPLRLLVLAFVIYLYSLLSYSTLTRFFWVRAAETLVAIGTTWLCWKLIDFLVEGNEKRWRSTPSSGKIAIGRLLGQIGKGLILITGAAVILYYAGFNLTAVLTGLGVGGIAVAFAAQKTLENLFGGIMIASDRTIRVGDFCRVGEYSGIVEDIGLRSTRIRTMDRTIVSVPNGQLASMSLENFTPRDKVRFNHTLELQYESSGERLRKVIDDMRRLLSASPKIEKETHRVRLIGLKNGALQIEVFAYILADNWDTFLEAQEELLLSLVDIVEENGMSLYMPNQGPQPLSDVAKGKSSPKTPRKGRGEQSLF